MRSALHGLSLGSLSPLALADLAVAFLETPALSAQFVHASLPFAGTEPMPAIVIEPTMTPPMTVSAPITMSVVLTIFNPVFSQLRSQRELLPHPLSD